MVSNDDFFMQLELNQLITSRPFKSMYHAIRIQQLEHYLIQMSFLIDFSDFLLDRTVQNSPKNHSADTA